MTSHRNLTVGKRPHTTRVKPNKEDIIDRMYRAKKRELIERGIIQNPATRPATFRFDWVYGELTG